MKLSQNQKTFLGVAGVVGLSVAAFFVARRLTEPDFPTDIDPSTLGPSDGTTKPPSLIGNVVSSPWVRNSLPLKKGMKGKMVTHWQEYLNLILAENNYPLQPVKEDGYFGDKTEKATIEVAGIGSGIVPEFAYQKAVAALGTP